MTRDALPSTVGDIVQQSRSDLAAAYGLLCLFSFNDNIDSDISLSLAGCPQDLFFEPTRSGCGLERQPPAISSQSISTATVSTISSGWVSLGRLRPARAFHINDARRRSAQDNEDSL
ncbi:hypothetical protein [Bradyrhizobium zhanjiangense]|uniref:hypothetical protein n=1 Tax=Bradyrhizobium zhanjiangense TaxID=1325107 RepID=UPI001008887B|nr:hypothetical protein [Bradyrhizobium zhanjiangense]